MSGLKCRVEQKDRMTEDYYSLSAKLYVGAEESRELPKW